MPVFITACGDVACVENPVGQERAVAIAREYILSHRIVDFEEGPAHLKRFAKQLREDGIDEEGLRRIATTTSTLSSRNCKFVSNFFYVHDDPIGLQGYNVSFLERVPADEIESEFTARRVTFKVSYCGTILQGDSGPRLVHTAQKTAREALTPKCR